MTAYPAGPRWVFAAAPIAFLLVGCVAASASMGPPSQAGSPSSTVPASPAASSATPITPSAAPAGSAGTAASAGTVPDVARITCGLDPMTNVLTQAVRPQADGVHLQVTNPTGADFLIDVRDLGGENAPTGTSQTAWPVPPGSMAVRCVDTSAPAAGDAGWVTLKVVDTDGVFAPTTLECPTDERVHQDVDYAADAEGRVGDPVELTKALVTAVRPSDKVEAAGYPAAETRLVRVIRDGRAIAIAEWTAAPGGGWWRTGSTVCAGDAISWGG